MEGFDGNLTGHGGFHKWGYVCIHVWEHLGNLWNVSGELWDTPEDFVARWTFWRMFFRYQGAANAILKMVSHMEVSINGAIPSRCIYIYIYICIYLFLDCKDTPRILFVSFFIIIYGGVP